MAEATKTGVRPHHIVLEDRHTMSVSGVVELKSFDDTVIVMDTSLGELTIQGQQLQIHKTNLETGELWMEGQVDEMVYRDSRPSGGKLWSKWFR